MALSFDPAPPFPVLGSPTFDTDAGAWLAWMAGQINLIATLNGFLVGIPTLYSTAGSFTWERPGKCKGLIVEGLGAGGGGGSASSTGGVARAACGGGAGSWAQLMFTSAPPAFLSLAVGAPGAGGPLGDNNGSSGGDTSISELGVTFYGGAGGNSAGVSTASVATVQNTGRAQIPNVGPSSPVILGAKNGEPGEGGLKLSSGVRLSGKGGASRYGSYGIARNANQDSISNAGDPAVGNGAGGGGAISSTTTGAVGGAGSPGLLVLTPLF